jgi:Bacterial nucleoid DNA-binding protein
MVGKKELVDSISEKTGMKKVNTRMFLDAAIEVMGEVLKKEGAIKIMNFGKLEVKNYKEQMKYNPQTKEMIPIPACNRVKFTCGKELFEELNS